jgi:hypothetical protein
MKPLFITLGINMGVAALYSILLLTLTPSEEEPLIQIFFMMAMHALCALIAGLAIVITQAIRQQSTMVGIGFLIACPLLFVIGLASCFGSMA